MPPPHIRTVCESDRAVSVHPFGPYWTGSHEPKELVPVEKEDVMNRLPDMMQWLEQGISITLLVDLFAPSGPDSRRIYAQESANLEWIPCRTGVA